MGLNDFITIFTDRVHIKEFFVHVVKRDTPFKFVQDKKGNFGDTTDEEGTSKSFNTGELHGFTKINWIGSNQIREEASITTELTKGDLIKSGPRTINNRKALFKDNIFVSRGDCGGSTGAENNSRTFGI